MATLETQYKQYQVKNPHSALMFEEWKRKILIPKLDSIQEIKEEKSNQIKTRKEIWAFMKRKLFNRTEN